MIGKKQYKTIDAYIRLFPKDAQRILKQVRRVIRAAAPGAQETISYQMPTFKLGGKNLVHFAAWEKHIGFYPTSSGTAAFKKALAKYKHAKGSIQFPLDKPMPVALIKKIVRFRVKEVEAQLAKKGSVWKTCSRGHRFLKSKRYPVCPICWPGQRTLSIKK